ncbi:MAG: hypothetical protein ACK4NF_00390, partial [Planctomycetota bacterium]
MRRKILLFKYLVALTVLCLGASIVTEVKLDVNIDKINVGICTAESIRKISSKQYYHNFDFLATCAYSIRIKGSTNLPVGTWLIVGLFYNDTRLDANKQVSVEEGGIFTTTLGVKGVFKGDKKIFPGEYKVEVWYNPSRQDPDITPLLSEFNSEIKTSIDLVVWDDTTNLPLHLEIKRLIKFYQHLISHLEFLAKRLNNEFNKYFPQDTPDEVKKEFRNAYKLYHEGKAEKIDYKKLCFKDLCFFPGNDKKEFNPRKWSEFTRSWKKTALFIYELARSARDRCLINPFPEIAGTATLTAEALLGYVNLYEKRLFGAPLQNQDPLNPIPQGGGISLTNLYSNFMQGLDILKNKVSLLKERRKSVSLVNIIRDIYNKAYQKIVKYINELPKKLKKEKDSKKLRKEDDKFVKNQLKIVKAIEKDIDILKKYAKQRKNKTLLAFTDILTNLTSQLKIFYAGYGALNYRKFLKPNASVPQDFLESFRYYRNNFLLSLKYLLQKMGNEE